MLAKLTKYELKATARTFALVYVLVLALAIVNRIFYAFDTSVFSMASYELEWAANIVIVLFTSMYVLMLVAMFVAVMIVVVLRFYRNMFTDEGYLMFTLPVKPWEHILAKMLGSAVWMLASIAVAGVSLLIMLSHKEVLEGFLEVFRVIGEGLRMMEVNITPFVVEIAIAVVMSIFTYALPIYACICIGQLWTKHRVAGAFVAYLVLNLVTQAISGIAMGGIQMSFFRTMEQLDYYGTPDITWWTEFMRTYHTLIVVSLVLSVAMSVAYFFICNYIMERKLDLE